LANKTKNQDILQWALAGARERLDALSEEMERVYRVFPSLRRSTRKARNMGAVTGRTERAGTHRRLSSAARAKLRAHAKRRWAEAKKAGRKRLG